MCCLVSLDLFFLGQSALQIAANHFFASLVCCLAEIGILSWFNLSPEFQLLQPAEVSSDFSNDCLKNKDWECWDLFKAQFRL